MSKASPRLAYRVEFDARALITAWPPAWKGAHAVSDTGIVFPYDGLTLYASPTGFTALDIDPPPPPANDRPGICCSSQALLDRANLRTLRRLPVPPPAMVLLTPPRMPVGPRAIWPMSR